MGKNGQGPTAAMLVIGDEILSGRIRDSNLHFMAGELTRHGIPMVEARIVTDDHAADFQRIPGPHRSTQGTRTDAS